MEDSKLYRANRFLSRFIWFISALLTLRVIVWVFEQRAHDKEYWLILAHVIPFLLVIFASAFTLLFVKHWVVRKLACASHRNGEASE